MPVQDFCAEDAVIFLEETEKNDGFRELSKFFCTRYSGIDPDALLTKIVEREQVISTWISRGIAIPHAIIPGFGPSRIVLGISKEGIRYDAPDDSPVYLMVLIVGDGAEHLQVLRQVALRLGSPGVYEKVVSAAAAEEAYLAFVEADENGLRTSDERMEVSRACFNHARHLAEEVRAKAILVHADCVEDINLLPDKLDDNILLVTISRYEDLRKIYPESHIIQIPFKGITRSNQIELSIIFALSRGLLRKDSRVVSVFGLPFSGVLDSIRFTDINKEFNVFFSLNTKDEKSDLEDQVLVRVIEIAGELAEEGREGKPSGTIFVLGDYDQVKNHCQQMIINPFKGYPEEERNILDPSLEETVKELSKIDGAFIIRGDGVLVSAGTYIRARVPPTELPSGLGSRHAAAAAITMVSRAISVALSESTRKISLFKNGERIMEL
jgi:DNA integrity scanning protein DisA with diadenylate cyclase activity/mannitol/fructose-specific phosphotransferase system IIA component (Ntr-type)